MGHPLGQEHRDVVFVGLFDHFVGYPVQNGFPPVFEQADRVFRIKINRKYFSPNKGTHRSAAVV